MREAVIMASNFQLDRVVFESDCQNLIQALKSKTAIPEIDAVLDDIWELSNHIPNIGFIWVPREANVAAHELAKLAAAVPQCSTTINNLPFSFTSLIKSEAEIA
ncbi:hypothetical protein PIB30_071370, partial [Stylosanthes scabra]|nr:hypothetical protein [Stylosanthes scabra]